MAACPFIGRGRISFKEAIRASPRSEGVPENTLKFTVGIMLASFGTFWGGEGLGISWWQDDLFLLVLVGFYLAVAGVLILWLRQYAPFQDLSTTATCAQVATYAYNVIKAANASGSSMNAMLKAQMLATALDVYFNNSIGTTSIDLTKVCSNPVACTSYENDSAAFGGASSLTVNQMLSYAASRSNTGGTSWYGQVKATQQLAKDAFDAINNQVAFGG